MYAWFPLWQDLLNKLLQQEEFGNHTLHPRCVACKAWLSSHAPSSTDVEIATVDKIFRCETCGEFFECKDCSLQCHACTPLHVLMVSACIDYSQSFMLINFA